MGRPAHRFLPTGNDDTGIAQRDLLGPQRDGTQPRSTHLVDDKGSRGVGKARRSRRLPRRVHSRRRR